MLEDFLAKLIQANWIVFEKQENHQGQEDYIDSISIKLKQIIESFDENLVLISTSKDL